MTITLRPSNSYRWANCHAFPQFAENLPAQPDNDAAREGTAAAWVAEVVLTGDAHSCEDLVGRTHKNGWLITEEMADDVQKYVSMIQKRGGVIGAEKFVTLSKDPLIEGTPDSNAHMINDKLLYIDDLKYGYRVVEIYENWQLLIYGAAVLRTLPPGSVNLIQLAVYQPRAFHRDGIYRKWVIDVAELNHYVAMIIAAGRKCLAENPLATPGPWCRDCPVASKCVAVINTAYSVIESIQSKHQRDMTVDELAKMLDFIEFGDKIMKSVKTAVVAEAEQRIRKERIPGWWMKGATGHRKFTVPAATVQMLTGIDPYKKDIITPAEAIRRGANEDVVNQISEKQQIGHKLVKMTEQDIAAAFSRKNV